MNHGAASLKLIKSIFHRTCS